MSEVDQDEVDVSSPAWVRVIGGNSKYKGKTFRFIKRTAQRIAVEREPGKISYFLPNYVELLSAIDDEDAEEESDTTRLPSETEVQWVRILHGKHKDKTLRFIKFTEKRIGVQLEEGKIIYLLPDHVDMNAIKPHGVSTLSTNPDPPRPVTPDNTEKEQAISPSQMPIVSDLPISSTSYNTIEMDDTDSYDFVSATYTFIDDREEIYNNDNDSDHEERSFQTAFQDLEEATFATLRPGDEVNIQSGEYAGKPATFIKRTPQRIVVNLSEDNNNKIRYLTLQSVLGKRVVGKNDETDPCISALCSHLSNSERVDNVTDSKSTRTLFGIIYGKDAVFFEITNPTSSTKIPEQFTVIDGASYYLAGIKVHNKVKSLTAAYLQASSHQEVSRRLQEKVGALHQLIPRKTASRLELLLSTAGSAAHIHCRTSSEFCPIEECGNDGCGFIPRRMIDTLLGSPSPQVCALQVRIAIPSMGIFKGMLMEKPGIKTIELPPSMKKVERVRVTPNISAVNKSAWLMINQTGVYPHESRIQQESDSFQIARVIPKMAQWMLVQKGVSRTYLQKPNRQHSNLVGVADPTNGIPPKCVFVTGILRNNNVLDDEFGDHILISRFPMTEASDGRVLPLLRKRPDSMSRQDWTFLCSKPFGLIIFGNPAPGDRSMPEQICQGDLDGDGYFVCWDLCIIQDAVIGDYPKLAPKNPPGTPSDDWWTATLDFMTNIPERLKYQKIIGRLHDRWLAKLRSNMQHDAVTFGRAFKDALVGAKHGGKVILPKRLWPEINHDLRCYLKANDTVTP